MKITLSYLLLFIYATIMIKPVMPTVSDIFAHIFNYSDHMITVHHEHGKSHVHLEYIEAAKKDSHGEATNNIPKKADTCSEHLMFGAGQHPSIKLVSLNLSNLLSQLLPVISLQEDFRPPITFSS